MLDFFANLYELFINAYGNELADHLYGAECDTGEIFGGYYVVVGVLMIVVTLMLSAIFYYVYVKPSKKEWYHWTYWLLSCILLQFIIAFYLPWRDLTANLVCDSFMFQTEDCVLFGIVNALLSGILFFIVSLIFKRFSVNGNNTPF